MNDYKELIKELRDFSYMLTNSQKAADAIEQLVKERDAAVADLNWAKPCSACKQQGLCVKGFWTDSLKCPFEWRGVRDE